MESGDVKTKVNARKQALLEARFFNPRVGEIEVEPNGGDQSALHSNLQLQISTSSPFPETCSSQSKDHLSPQTVTMDLPSMIIPNEPTHIRSPLQPNTQRQMPSSPSVKDYKRHRTVSGGPGLQGSEQLFKTKLYGDCLSSGTPTHCGLCDGGTSKAATSSKQY